MAALNKSSFSHYFSSCGWAPVSLSKKEKRKSYLLLRRIRAFTNSFLHSQSPCCLDKLEEFPEISPWGD